MMDIYIDKVVNDHMNNKVIEKISRDKFFEDLAKILFDKNFGTKTKNEIELIAFKHYIEAAKEVATIDGVIDENKISDYKIGYDLGIMPSRVRNLKLKTELQSSNYYDWKAELTKVLMIPQNVRKEGDYLKITIRSRCLFYAVEDWVEDNGNTLNVSLNPKELKILKTDFYKLMNELCLIDDEQNKKSLAALKKKYEIEDKVENIIEGCFSLINAGAAVKDITECIIGSSMLKDNAEKIISCLINLFDKVKKS